LILIVSPPDNPHVDKVASFLKRPFVVFDNGWFPASSSLIATFNREAERLLLTLPDGSAVDLAEVGAVWHRRISAMALDPELRDETAKLFAWSESNEAQLGLWYSLHCYWMNPPPADEISQRKLRQLQLARSLELPIPETLITNDPQAARAFIEESAPHEVVRKAFRNIVQAPRETSIVTEADMALIDTVRFAPVIFQRFVPAELDLRVTIVDDEIFATAIRSSPARRADYRLGVGEAEVFPYDLPDDVGEKLLALMRAFDLRYGGIDLRVTPEGEHVFLEVNPAGEYLFVSERTGQPIPQAIAAALDRHDLERLN